MKAYEVRDCPECGMKQGRYCMKLQCPQHTIVKDETMEKADSIKNIDVYILLKELDKMKLMLDNMNALIVKLSKEMALKDFELEQLKERMRGAEYD